MFRSQDRRFAATRGAREQTDEDLVIVVADGLGHGYGSQVASTEAVRQLYEYPDLPPKRC